MIEHPEWVQTVAIQALRHGWVEITVTAEMGRQLLALVEHRCALPGSPVTPVGAGPTP